MEINEYLSRLVGRRPELAECLPAIEASYEVLKNAYRQGKKLLVCGNGGSAADSEHIVGELMKSFTFQRALPDAFRRKLLEDHPENGDYLVRNLHSALPAISLVSQTALMTAFANDVTADMVFAQQVFGYGTSGDVLIGLSTSGNSKNVLLAMQVARSIGLRTIGFTGRAGGALRTACEVAICVPEDLTADIQEGHIAIYHTLCEMLEKTFFTAASK